MVFAMAKAVTEGPSSPSNPFVNGEETLVKYWVTKSREYLFPFVKRSSETASVKNPISRLHLLFSLI